MKKKICIIFTVLFGMIGMFGCGTEQKINKKEWIPDETITFLEESESRTETATENTTENETDIGEVAKNVLVIGNSITLGFGNHGMASSSPTTDYYYLLNAYLQEKNPGIHMKRLAGYGWENAVTSEERLSFLEENVEPQLDEHVDLIIIQLGDNINTDEKQVTFATDCEKMLEWFWQKRPKARILWVFGRYNLYNASVIQQACAKYSAEYVDISIISTDEKYTSSVGSEYEKEDGTIGVIKDYGVASHPGDYGMQVIYELIVKQLAYE